MENFKTIKNNVKEEIIVQKSRFICNLIKVETKQEAEYEIKKIKKQYHDARHNCIAYRILENEQLIEKSSDDGEPSGTAGAPMLNILQKNNLCNVLLVVTRYFGGILLGTGGLVRAYSEVTLKAIQTAKMVEKCMGLEAETVLEYNFLDIFKYYCNKNNINIVDIKYSDKIICKIELEERKMAKLMEDYKLKKINLLDLKNFNKKLIEKSIIK